jgi:hypothetical protein
MTNEQKQKISNALRVKNASRKKVNNNNARVVLYNNFCWNGYQKQGEQK